jgi:DNA repair exonuclease SbcCD ATPase subunit
MTVTIGAFTCNVLTAQPFGYEGDARAGLTARTFAKAAAELHRVPSALSYTVAQAESARKNSTGVEQTNAAISKGASQVVLDKITDDIKQLEARKEAYQQASAAALEEASAAVRGSDEKLNKTRQEIQQLEALKAQRIALNRIERENVALADAKKELEVTKKSESSLTEKADTAKEQETNLSTLLDEIELLKEATGEGKKKLETVREEIALRKQARDLAERTGISEFDARDVLRQQAELLKGIDNQPTGTIKERREQRSEKRQEERDRKRDERVAEAQRKREERNRKNNKKDDEGIENKVDLDQLRKDAAEKAAKAQQELADNIEKQTDIQERIEKAIKDPTGVKET